MIVLRKLIVSFLFFLILLISVGYKVISISLIGAILLIIFTLFDNKLIFRKKEIIIYTFYIVYISISLYISFVKYEGLSYMGYDEGYKIITQYIYWLMIPLLIYTGNKNRQYLNIDRFLAFFLVVTLIVYIINFIGYSIKDFLPISNYGLRDLRPVYLSGGIKLKGIIRSTFLFGEASFLGGFLSCMYFLTRKKIIKGLILLNVFFTFSRLAWISFCIAYFISVLSTFKIKKIKFNYKNTIPFLLIILFFVFVGDIFLSRILFFSKDDISYLVRFNEILTSLNMIKSNPLFGVGLGRYGFEYINYEVITDARHFVFPIAGSYYTLVFAEFGIIGIILLFTVILSVFKSATGANRIAFLCLLIYWFNNSFINLFWEWIFIGFIINNKKI